MDHHDADDITTGDAEPQTRRSFFRASAMTAGPAALLAAGAVAAQGVGSGSGSGNGGGGISIPNLYPGWSARNFAQIRSDEDSHVIILQGALGSNALPPLPLNTAALTLPTANPILFAAVASVLENTEVGTYLYTGGLLYDRANLAAASSIYGTEAYHSGFLNTLVDFPVTLNGEQFVRPFTLQQTLANVSPYFADPSQIAALAAAISPTPSPLNDINIFNFALALERAGSTFYNINVPRFLGV